MRRQHDRYPGLCDPFHQGLEELPPGKGIETSERFVEEQDVGTFRERKRESDLRALPARK